MNKKKLIILISIIITLAILVCVGVFAMSGSKKAKIADKLDLGEKYLEELKYEKALAAYKEVLKIDPKNVDAYLGIVDTYVAMGEYEKALKYAEEAYEETGDDIFAERIEEIKALSSADAGAFGPDDVVRVENIIWYTEAAKEGVPLDMLETVPESSVTYVAVGGHGNPDSMGMHFQNYAVGANANPNEGYRYVRCESDTIEFYEYDFNESLGYEVPWFLVPESGHHYIYLYYEPISGASQPTEEPQVIPTPEPVPGKIQVTVDIKGMAAAYSEFMYSECMGSSTTFGLFDINGDGVPELFSGQGADVVGYWQGHAREIVCDMVMYEWYYNEVTKQPGMYYYYDWNGIVEEWILFYRVDTTTTDDPAHWLSWGEQITENIDLSQYTYIDSYAYDKVSNMDAAVMEETLRGWFANQEGYEYLIEEVDQEETTPDEESTVEEIQEELPDDYVIDWKDANLETAMREVTGIYDRDIVYGDVKDITELDLSQSDINDISALSNLTNLETLDLRYNQISDISALCNLENLESLKMNNNEIGDISTLSNLLHIRVLWLSNNEISDISPLSNLMSLESLELEGNGISDISPLSNLTNLTTLWMDDNNISDISALSNLTSLEGLALCDNSITDISALSSLISLRYLGLSGNAISDIGTLSMLTNLTDMELDDNEISDISVLSNLTSLEHLGLSNNPITDYSPVSHVPGVNR